MSSGLGVKPRWAEAAFASFLSEPVRNGVYKPKDFHGRGAKIVNMGELFANPRLTDVPMRRVELTESEIRRFSVQKGDLLFARRSLVAEGAGKCCVVLEVPEPTAFESSIIRARPDPNKADPLFLYYYFKSPAGLHGLDMIRRQVAVAGITGTDLANLTLVVPPASQQRVIADILGRLDEKIELNQRLNETLEAMARALFNSWFVDFELVPTKMTQVESRDVPPGWRAGTLAEVAIARRQNVAPADCGDETPYIGLEHMPRRSIALETWGFAGDVKSAKSRFEKGDILFGKLRPYFHKVGIAPVEGVCSTD
ncbi:MAG: restriction endonuclease subunit S, partial [Gammaproteobacteria bacterium]|nr:restriction endonuclease subunit S [Gammaproteobacteria bacterium]